MRSKLHTLRAKIDRKTASLVTASFFVVAQALRAVCRRLHLVKPYIDCSTPLARQYNAFIINRCPTLVDSLTLVLCAIINRAVLVCQHSASTPDALVYALLATVSAAFACDTLWWQVRRRAFPSCRHGARSRQRWRNKLCAQSIRRDTPPSIALAGCRH